MTEGVVVRGEGKNKLQPRMEKVTSPVSPPL
jgi:hypothetical protein